MKSREKAIKGRLWRSQDNDNERSYEYVDIELMNIANILKIDEHCKYT